MKIIVHMLNVLMLKNPWESSECYDYKKKKKQGEDTAVTLLFL